MEQKIDIHNYKGRFDSTVKRINGSLDISDQDKLAINRLKDYCICQGITYGKIDAYLFYASKLARMLHKPIEQATKEDLMKVVAELNQSHYSEETKVCFKIMIRKFYKMLKGIEEKGKYPPEVDWINTTISKNHEKLPEELLTEEEVEKIIRSARTVRDKALLAVIAESGCRVSEIGTMKIRQITFEQYGARLTVSGKTGTRKILVISTAPYLREWLNQHPLNDNSDAYLWYNSGKNSFLSYARIAHILKAAANKAGIKKRVYLHLLRHTRATRMANMMSEAAMKQYFGWTQSSKMASIYVHMSGKDTDDAILKANGIEIKKEEFKQCLKPLNCEGCKTINEATNRFCKVCGLPLVKEEAQEIIKTDTERKQYDEMMMKALADPRILEIIKEKMKGINR
ncbi:MAG: site-specific integrase [Candidatus Pacearchaeota archaeon]|jgi:site-specific recombinase XerD